MSQENLEFVLDSYARYNVGERRPELWYWHADAEYHASSDDPDSDAQFPSGRCTIAPFVSIGDQTTPPDHRAPVRLQDGEVVILALKQTSWIATLLKIATLGLYILWWKAAWFVVTDRRLIARDGVLNKTEVALPLHFVQDARVYRSWLAVGRVDVSTAGGDDSAVVLHPLKAEDARRLADTIISQAKRVVLDHTSLRLGADPTTDALVRLGQLRDAGVLTEDEFAQQKARILRSE